MNSYIESQVADCLTSNDADSVRGSTGIIAIGRNEGTRLVACLASVSKVLGRIVYVDSGSTDDSVSMAREAGAEVVELDLSKPFTAGRARNEGFAQMRQRWPDINYVQFVDGDCQLVDGWIDRALSELESNPGLAIVCGRRKERYPERSIYNRLCDLEWDTPVGITKACGGDFLIRVDAFAQVGGFNPSVIAGEEPEMCVRLAREGWKIARVDADMTLHDADMKRFSQYWQRCVRSGHAYAEGMWRHGGSEQKHEVRPVLSILFWALILPVSIVALAMFTNGVGLIGFVLYVIQWWRIQRARSLQRSKSESCTYATFVLIGKFAQLQGIMTFITRKVLRKQGKIIEYKQPVTK